MEMEGMTQPMMTSIQHNVPIPTLAYMDFSMVEMVDNMLQMLLLVFTMGKILDSILQVSGATVSVVSQMTR
jgi:hypothetical protein